MKRFYLSLLATSCYLISLAQEKTTNVDINVNKGGGGFWTSPWVWIVGAAVFILLLVALLRGGNKS
jgi:hypothetical protein